MSLSIYAHVYRNCNLYLPGTFTSYVFIFFSAAVTCPAEGCCRASRRWLWPLSVAGVVCRVLLWARCASPLGIACGRAPVACCSRLPSSRGPGCTCVGGSAPTLAAAHRPPPAARRPPLGYRAWRSSGLGQDRSFHYFHFLSQLLCLLFN